ncbi:hypothetical protein EDB84DRAFT_523875 [Lactarius hengduanensis]|nr:hypothetical protein EDB84DRAFT_523875 [Lactarius hengduanensis]
MYLQSHMTRWTLGASDIMFTNPAFSTFFRKGETFRGTGIYQPAIDTAIEKLRTGAWITYTSSQRGRYASLTRTRRSCRQDSRVYGASVGNVRPPLHRQKYSPTIIPTRITGFDKRMPEGRHAMEVLRTGARLSVTFGAPVSLAAVHGATRRSGVVPGEAAEAQEEERRREDGEVRIALTEVVQRVVEAAGVEDLHHCRRGHRKSLLHS